MISKALFAVSLVFQILLSKDVVSVQKNSSSFYPVYSPKESRKS